MLTGISADGESGEVANKSLCIKVFPRLVA